MYVMHTCEFKISNKKKEKGTNNPSCMYCRPHTKLNIMFWHLMN